MSAVAAALGAAGLISSIMANQSNQSNFDSQMGLTKYQYEDMKKYNSASEQVRRLRAAGINPALAFGQNAGLAQAVSQPSPNPINPLDMNGLSSIAQGITLNDVQAKNIQANTDKQTTESELNRIDLRTRFIEKLSDIENKLADTHLKQGQRDYLSSQREYLQKQIKFADERMEWENHNLRLEAQYKTLQNQALVIQNKYLPMLNEQQVKSLISTCALNYAAAGEHKQNTQKLAQETMSEVIRSGILGEDFYKGLPDAITGKHYSDSMTTHPAFKKVQSVVQHVIYPMLEHAPNLFVPLK